MGNEGLTVQYIKEEILPEFFGNYWIRKNALDRKNQRQLVETTVAIGGKIGGSDVIKRIIEHMKDENEKFRNVVLETMEKIFFLYGVADINSKYEQRLIDGMLFCFQNQQSEETGPVLNAFGVLINQLGIRTKEYIPEICGTIQYR